LIKYAFSIHLYVHIQIKNKNFKKMKIN